MAQKAQHKAKKTPVPTSSKVRIRLGSERLRFGLIVLAFDSTVQASSVIG
jgi:hypothetical protein